MRFQHYDLSAPDPTAESSCCMLQQLHIVHTASVPTTACAAHLLHHQRPHSLLQVVLRTRQAMQLSVSLDQIHPAPSQHGLAK